MCLTTFSPWLILENLFQLHPILRRAPPIFCTVVQKWCASPLSSIWFWSVNFFSQSHLWKNTLKSYKLLQKVQRDLDIQEPFEIVTIYRTTLVYTKISKRQVENNQHNSEGKTSCFIEKFVSLFLKELKVKQLFKFDQQDT